jgi:nucleoside-diphosphate-sugar epimerase
LRFFNLYGSRQDGRSPYSGVITLFAIEWRGASPSQFSATEIRSAISLMSADAVAALTVEP